MREMQMSVVTDGITVSLRIELAEAAYALLTQDSVSACTADDKSEIADRLAAQMPFWLARCQREISLNLSLSYNLMLTEEIRRI